MYTYTLVCVYIYCAERQLHGPGAYTLCGKKIGHSLVDAKCPKNNGSAKRHVKHHLNHTIVCKKQTLWTNREICVLTKRLLY